MSQAEAELLVAFELHSVEGIRAAIDAGLDVRHPVGGKPPIQCLTEMYTRSDRFPACVRLLLEAGAELEDPVVAPVLLDDAAALAAAIRRDRSLLEHRTTLVSAFTPLVGVSLLHVAVEYGHLSVARTLLENGADVDARAAVDAAGLNGHTPLFHAVNAHGNRSEPLLRLLLDAGARTDILLRGITWGQGFEWETTVLDVTPISYAQLGLLPQMHRDERDIYSNISRLLEAARRDVPRFENVPNRYLRPHS
ncbi:MAG TPA: ankyrin repeat domain-containing protein [Candidatus Polarisedimenticolaceae bacterium]|nr:ankyrin repeat domain-containing protein [Candidatus Polarisedimenticolaceae bacterium]